MTLQSALVVFAVILPAALVGTPGEAQVEGPEPGGPRMTIVFDNVPHVEGLETAGGYACVVEGLEKTVLFDTGADGEILLANMRKLGIDPAGIDVVFLSHMHRDHTGGLRRFLEINPDVEVWMPGDASEPFRNEVRAAGARVRGADGPVRLFKGAHSTGQMGDTLVEQSLVLEGRGGLALVTGCAHPDIAEIVAVARRQHEREVALIAGGFHLRSLGEAEFGEVLRSLEKSGVARVAPTHCTGDGAVAAFRGIWGEGFIAVGCGAVIAF